MFAFVMDMKRKPTQKLHYNIFVVKYSLRNGKIQTAKRFIIRV